MSKEDPNFEKNVKIAFSRVKEDILSLKKEIEALKEELIGEKHNSPQETKGWRRHRGGIEAAPSMRIGDKEYDLAFLKQDIEDTFLELPEHQFKVFLKIYELEEQENRPLTYSEVSNALNISQNVLRSYLTNMVKKKLPLRRIKHQNKGYVSIPKEFRKLKLISEIIAFRSLDGDQSKLF